MESITHARRTNLMRPVVIRFGRLGDMVLLAPLLHRLRRRHGEPCALLGTGPWSAALYEAHPDVAEISQVNRRHQPLPLSPERWRMLHVLRRCRDSPIYICETESRALAKIRRMLRLARIDPAHCAFITDTAALSDEHWIGRLLRFGLRIPSALETAAVAGVDDAAYPAPRLFLRDADRIDRDAWLSARGFGDRPLVLVQPANRRTIRWSGVRDAADDDKSWPLQSWIELLRAMLREMPHAQILLCGSPAEAPLLESIQRLTSHDHVAVAARDLPLRRLMALAEIADGMVSVDTGPAHVAAAMGCMLVVLYGAQSPRLWLPRGPTRSAVIAVGGPPARSRVDQISVAEVIDAWRRISESCAQTTD